MKLITKLLSFCLTLVLFVTTLMPSAAMASPSLDQEKQVFILSILSNAVSSNWGTQKHLQELLKERVTKVLETPSIQKDIGNWDVVWGPVVYKPKISKYAAHSMYVAQNGNQYVVALAGTNPTSLFDWIENAEVKEQVNWDYGDKPLYLEPKISKGAYLGLNILLQEMKSSDQTVLEFLGEKVKNSADNIEIIFAGHSLGGILSSTFALAALDQKSQWSGDKPFKISVYPSAGPTAGNLDFSTYYDSRLEASTKRIWNDIDMFPHMWNETMLSEIPSLYEPEIEASKAVEFLVRGAKKLAQGGDYTQIETAMPGLEGTINLSSSLCPNLSSSTSTFIVDEELSQV
ncbi:MAG: lipase family protein, partial [Moorea sp. SIO2B7]|nr:lipase family protein [Moorena sp. SIO2B7]